MRRHLQFFCLLALLQMAVSPVASAQALKDLLSAVLGPAIESMTGIPAEGVFDNSAPADQTALSQWNIPAGNYSGIAPIEPLQRSADGLLSGRYAIVSDKGASDGFFVWKIVQDPSDGHVIEVANEGFRANKVSASSGRDCEGIAFLPSSVSAPGSTSAGTVFISGEGDNRILEYDLQGQRTGRELDVPAVFKGAKGNQGLEALTYGGAKKPLFWATSETMVPADGTASTAAGASDAGTAGTMNLLRLVSFGPDLKPGMQWAYRTDGAQIRTPGPTYAFGVPELCAMPDGKLLVLEREANVTNAYVGSSVTCKLYCVNPKRGKRLRSDRPLADLPGKSFLRKKLIDSWSTSLSLAGINWANYEGMCLGATLQDGSQTLILVSDSQGGYGKAGFNLSDFIKVIVIN